jgi:AraC-like DNA-binding protein
MSFERTNGLQAARTRHAAERHAAIALAAKRRLAARLDAPNRIAEIAGELGLSPFHLAHVFQRQTGMTLHRYLQQLRMASALVRLHDGEANLSRLALDLGFSSHSHFTAVFRRHFGRSPSSFRATAAVESRTRQSTLPQNERCAPGRRASKARE